MKKAASEPENIKCLQCGRRLTLPKDRISDSETQARGYAAYTTRYKTYGFVPWCKDCLVSQLNLMASQYGDLTTALFYLCRIIDFPVIACHIDHEETTAEGFLTAYLQNLFRDSKVAVTKGFMAGDMIRERDIPIFVEAEVLDGPIYEFSSSESDLQDAYIKWGRNHNYSQEDYADLEQIYQNIVSQNGIVVDDKTGRAADGTTDMAIIEAACNLLESRKCRKKGRPDDAKRYYEMYDKAMASQLLRGRDMKEKQVGAALVQDIVKYCEQDGFIEPWDRKIKYPHKKDVVDQILLHMMNYVGHLCADVFNIHVKKLDKVPKEYKLDGKNDEFATEDTDFEKQFHKNLEEIADFKSRQHFSDDDYNEDSVDTDADTDTDEALFGSAED